MYKKLSAPQIVKFFICCVILLCVIFATQVLQNAYATELLSDANGHYVTTLLAYDYIMAGFPGNPVSYAVDYFIHYPSIRIGNNPPAFYAFSSVWALLTNDSIHAALVLSALLALIYCVITLFFAGRVLGVGAGVVIAFVTALLPIFREVAASFLIDIPIGILSLAAALSYASFLNKNTARSAIWFSLLAATALMVKLSALFLALMVPLAILISGKFYLVRNKLFWLPLLIIGILTMPWYLYTFESLTEGAKTQWTILYPFQALAGYLVILARNLSYPGIALIAAGIVERIRFVRSNPDTEAASLWAVLIALLGAVILFQALMPTNILDRYLITALCPAMLLLWQGAQVSGAYIMETVGRATRVPESVKSKTPYLIAALILMITVVPTLPFTPAPGNQMGLVAKKVAEALPANNPVVLIGSDGSRESSFIAQLAQLDQARPSMFVVRGSRLLGKEEGFMNIDYMPKFDSPEDVLRELERLSITLVVLDKSKKAREWRHNRDIAWLVENKPDLWRQVWSMDNPGLDGTLSFYILKSSETKTVDMTLLRKEFRPNSVDLPPSN